MSRKLVVRKRHIAPDPKYNSVLCAKFINCMLMHGEKNIASKIFYQSLEEIGKIKPDQELDILKEAIENVKPLLEVKTRRVGGANYQIPVEVRGERSLSLAIKWIIRAARERKTGVMYQKLSAEILDAVEKKGGAFKKRADIHTTAEKNKTFAHYRW